ncbi:insulinase family protein [Xanthomonas campestris]|uniref:M16 family metallopeptidase n=1 Tax=Xanthomonas campestris TaxID=339 RepID=UPI00235A2030|nr:pitrilysin family protein [Xanthomonas campestris]MDC8748232.1 insulinase family protein [Xanthomonas campestris]
MNSRNFRACVVAGISVIALGVAPAAVAAAASTAPTSLASLVRSADIPFETFTLDNGLRVIVHTDRSVKLVSVNVIYDVGAKHEPAGRSGFAHLFEHLMFSGSENAPGDFFAPLKAAGATDQNGMTQSDKTSYYQTVPTPALERTLFMESDRMGHLLGAISQLRLDEQRGVVKNEKRQGDNEPGGLVEYRLTERLFPSGHPYGHSVIGSMADLDAATLDDVKAWFRNHYGPNNATVTLAGDIDTATARQLMIKYFGDIPAGPRAQRPTAPIPSLAKRLDETMTDRVSATSIMRVWTIPGRDDPRAIPLEAAAGVMGALATSPLQDILVRNEKLFTGASASVNLYDQGGMFVVAGEVADGVDPVRAGRRLDEVIAAFLRDGPSVDALQRYVTMDLTSAISGLDAVSSRGYALADGSLLDQGPAYLKERAIALAAQTPAQVRAAAAQWLGRPVYALTLAPGPRLGYEESQAENEAPAPKKTADIARVVGTRGPLPAIGTFTDLNFPKVEHARLSNGIEVIYAQRSSSPMSYASIELDAGIAADPADGIGTQNLLLSLLQQGTRTRSQKEFANALERLGAQIATGSSRDRTSLTVVAPSGNLAPAIDLLSDMTRNPALAPADIALQRDSLLAGIAQEATDPQSLGSAALLQLVNPASPYAKDRGTGDAKVVAALTRNDLIAYQRAWFRPDKAKVFVVSGRPLAEIQPMLERSLGSWRSTGTAGMKDFSATPRPATPRIVLIDRPDSAQAMILAGQYTTLKGSDELTALEVANDGLGGGILSRLNAELRERKNWTYGVRAGFRTPAYEVSYSIVAPVQSDKTGESIKTIRDIITAYVGPQPMTQAEFMLAVDSRVHALPGEYATSKSILDAMRANDIFQRPDDYDNGQTSRYRALTLTEAHRAIDAVVDPNKLVWVVVADAAKVRPQLDTLGLPITLVPADPAAAPAAPTATATP